LLGTINMALTVSRGFPFGLLVAIALVVLLVIRWPYVRTAWEPASAAPPVEPVAPKISVDSFPWVYDVNLWYDGLAETRRSFVMMAVLVIAGGINMLLTIHSGFPFGLLFLLVLLAVLLIRAPYVAGWLEQPTPFQPAPSQPAIAPAAAPEQIAHETAMAPVAMHSLAAEPAPIAAEPAEPPPAIAAEPMPEPDRPA
jgi:hypothetical protein